MIVPVRRSDGNKEWAIIEVYGDFEKEKEKPIKEKTLENNYIGNMYYLLCGTPVMIVGNQVLHGKEVHLDKPFAVLEKNECSSPHQYHKKEYIVKAIVKKKLLFRTRPRQLAVLRIN